MAQRGEVEHTVGRPSRLEQRLTGPVGGQWRTLKLLLENMNARQGIETLVVILAFRLLCRWKT
jgi:hypothetical protein